MTTRKADALGKSPDGTPSPSLPTPGPWVVSDEGYNQTLHDGGVEIIGPEGWFVAHVWGDLPGDPQDANARLIAAAHDLLAALKPIAALKVLNGDLALPHPRELRRIVDAARAAIAKATNGGAR